MDFHHYQSLFAHYKQAGAIPRGERVREFYLRKLYDVTKDGQNTVLQMDNVAATKWNNLVHEMEWYDAVRPYYKVWPAIQAALLRVPLDIQISEAALPMDQVFAVRLAVGQELPFNDDSVISVLVSSAKREANVKLQKRPTETTYVGRNLLITIQMVNFRGCCGHYGPFMIQLDTAGTFEEHLSWFLLEDGVTLDDLRAPMRLALAVLLMSNDPSIITPEVLAKDRRNFEATADPKYIAKAKQRGIVGWNIGEQYETCPHYRRPHFGIRHTGKGRAVPRIVPIKGAVVHRKKLTEVPTGYIMPDGVEVEPSCP